VPPGHQGAGGGLSILVTRPWPQSAATAGGWVSLYYGAITLGRFAVGLAANRLGNRCLIRLGLLLAMAWVRCMFALPGLPASPVAGRAGA
jgi:hypothetical protein